MTIRDEALKLVEAARDICASDWRRDDQRINQLCDVVERLAELLAASAPEFKEAP